MPRAYTYFLADSSHLPALLDLITPLVEEDYLRHRPFEALDEALKDSDAPDAPRIIGAKGRSGPMVGCVMIQKRGPEEVEIGCLAVHESVRGHGIASHLLRVAEGMGADPALYDAFWGYVLVQEPRLFLNRGYEPAKKRPAWVDDLESERGCELLMKELYLEGL